jgi:NAD-dependent SIR2 family protein deacetylase
MTHIIICPTCARPYDKRTEDQNSKMWPMLRDVAQQVVWHGQKLSDKEWKEVFSAALNRQKVVPGIEGGFVVIGSSTSRMTKLELSELIDLMYAFGAEQGVKWTPTSPPANE